MYNVNIMEVVAQLWIRALCLFYTYIRDDLMPMLNTLDFKC